MKQGDRRQRYLFIRALEACNASCSMCRFSDSHDTYRFTTKNMRDLIPHIIAEGVSFVRFTGGEPLLHSQLSEMIRICRGNELKVSVITNGFILKEKLQDLCSAGAEHLIVSIDGATATTHDSSRKRAGIFDRAIEGIKRAVDAGLIVRANTVVGPQNYREMPALQQLLAGIGVSQWELSTLKLGTRLLYDDFDSVIRVGEEIYSGSNPLIPTGPPWFGATREQQKLYFEEGIAPRPLSGYCHVTKDILYYDPRNGELFCCSCLSHRDDNRFEARVDLSEDNPLSSPEFIKQSDWFGRHGVSYCKGCSSTAAGYNERILREEELADWSY